uniref:K Homology domain-containing protein n=1 Tax=Strigamia maritima TaxID=126957 RepID=T1J4B4_STRMM
MSLDIQHDNKMFQEHDAYEPTYSYDEVFPALPESDPRPMDQLKGTWNQKMKMSSSVITQVFRVPVEERRYKEIDSQFGGQGEQAKICADIMQRTGAHIEVNSSKDQSLTILVTGKQDAVMNARREIINSLQTQANGSISIPKEHHRFILGKSGKNLHDIELSTATKISVPRPDENSDTIRILGTKDGIEKARHEIQLCSDEQAKLDFVRLSIPKMYHPFISGAHNENVNRITSETNVRINMPPSFVIKDEITISGEKEGVAKAKEIITKIYEEKKLKCQTVSMEVRKSHHKYVIGPRGNTIQEILAHTGVSVEMPQLDNPVETITLRGEQDKLGAALNLVYAKANSMAEAVVAAPSWLHKFIIGKKGANIRLITQDLPKLHVEFRDVEDKILIEGPPEEVEQAKNEIEKMSLDLQNRLHFVEVEVEPKFHKHIIGKNGANVNRLKQEANVLINIPSGDERNNIIRIEGNAQGVARARQELEEMVKKLENEKSRDIIIDQKFHRNIIGSKGEKIKEIRDKFNQVNVTFPDTVAKCDVVTIRGPKEDVEQCYKYLQKLNKELIESNYSIAVVIYKQLHKYIIGKAGATIKKIRDETDTKIELPAEGISSDAIVITGKKANVEEARRRILEIQNTHENIASVNVSIPAKLHNSVIGAKGRLIRSITEECGVNILFPQEGSGSDEVTIRGPKEDVEKARRQLQELANEKQLASFTCEVRAKPEHHKFLIGRNGANIRKVRDKTGARIIFPSSTDEDRELIVIIGKQEAANQAKVELEILIKNLDNIIERDISVDPKFHRHFVARRGQVLREISEEYGGVAVSFPRSGCNSDTVVLKGAKDCVDAAVQRINEIVNELQQQVTIEFNIAQPHHRTVMGAKGCKVQYITQEFDVQIKFPDRENREGDDDVLPQNGDEVQYNGDLHMNDGEIGTDDKPRKNDIIKITGKMENCDKAKQALLALVPITVEVSVPYDFHRFIIGQKGKDVRELMKDFDVNIVVPPVNQQSDVIKVSGTPSNVEQAKLALENRVEQLEKEKMDRTLRSFHLSVEVDPKHHPKIIGRKGAVISKIRQDHDVQIQFPEKGVSEENIITITGYEKNAHAAKETIEKIVQELENMVSEDVKIDHRVHSRLIGAKGRNIRKIMEQYKVDIRFPRDSDSDPNLVVISGVEVNVQEAKDHLLNLEDNYMQDINDAEYMRQYTEAPSKKQEDFQPRTEPKGFVVKGGPWEQTAPDTSSNAEFPSFGCADAPKNIVWGPRR